MKLSTKGRYGTRFMLELALGYEKKQPILLREIAEKQGISLKYLEQIVILLRNSELIRSIRGAKGGYILAKSPENIKLSEILVALEGNMDIADCITRDIWEAVSNKINEFLSSITLEELRNRKKE